MTATHWACAALVPGCQDCTNQRHRDVEHECDDWCRLLGEQVADPGFHRRWHEPIRCSRPRCRTVLDDRRGNNYEIHRLCGYKTCVQIMCPGCRRITGGWGPVECPCEMGREGHGTWGEFRRPGAGRWVKASIRAKRRRGMSGRRGGRMRGAGEQRR